MAEPEETQCADLPDRLKSFITHGVNTRSAASPSDLPLTQPVRWSARPVRTAPEPASPKPYTINLGLTLAPDLVADLRDADVRGDAAGAAEILAASFNRRRADVLKAVGRLPDARWVVDLPRLHSAVLRAPRREFESWLGRGAADGLVSTVVAVRGHKVGSPVARRPHGRHEAVAAAYALGQANPVSVAHRAAVDPLHAGGFRGLGKEIALLDTGLADGHGFRVAAFARVDRRAQVTVGPPRDHGTHGTQMASVVRAVCPDADLSVASVMQLAGGEEGGDLFQIQAGLQWVIDRKMGGRPIEAANLSLAVYDAGSTLLPALRTALRLAHLQGVQPVVAIGNFPRYRSLLADDALGVGALTVRGSPARFSGRDPHVVAAGCDIPCLLPSGDMIVCSGTSNSAAVATGVLTLLSQATGRAARDCVVAVRSAATDARAGRWFASPRRWGDGPVVPQGAWDLLRRP
jgi:hypothetical protein